MRLTCLSVGIEQEVGWLREFCETEKRKYEPTVTISDSVGRRNENAFRSMYIIIV